MLETQDLRAIGDLLSPIKEDIREIKTNIREIKSTLASIEFRLTNVETWMQETKPVIVHMETFINTYERKQWAGKQPEDIVRDLDRRLKLIEATLNIK